jgi:hypothetical protein
MIAEVTGSTPKTSGVYGIRGYDRTYYAPGSNCAGNAGAPAIFDSSIDKDSTMLTAGGTLGGPEASQISQIDTSKLPMHLVTVGGQLVCKPVLPHQFINSGISNVFEVVHQLMGSNARTAWADVHPSYEILNGPSGTGIDDLYTPEINAINSSGIPIVNPDGSMTTGAPTNKDYTQSFIDGRYFDSLNAQAVIHEIDGLDSTGSKNVGVPTIFGMSFEAMEVGQQLANPGADDPTTRPDVPYSSTMTSEAITLLGGYQSAFPNGTADGGCLYSNWKLPGFWNNALVSAQFGCNMYHLSTDPNIPPPKPPRLVNNALTQLGQIDYVSYWINLMYQELTNKNLLNSTLIIISAKNGNAPVDPKVRKVTDPSGYAPYVTPAFADYSDVSLLWLNPSTRTTTTYNSTASKLSAQYKKLALQDLLSDAPPHTDITTIFNSPFTDARAPDYVGETVPGVLYGSGGSAPLLLHGGLSDDDRNVVLVLASPIINNTSSLPVNNNVPVETRQLAPTILNALGLKPSQYSSLLAGATAEGTQPLPITLY